MTERNDGIPGDDKVRPNEPGDDELRANEAADDAAREARLDAMLSLTSAPPPSLDALVAGRRASADRVILPVPEVSRRTERQWRRYAIPAGLIAAAAVLFALLQLQSASHEREEEMMARRDSIANAPPIVVPDSTMRPEPADTAPGGSLEKSLPNRDDVSLGMSPPLAGERAVYSARFTALRAPALDSALTFLASHGSARATISYPAGNEGLADVATRLRAALEARGVPPQRVEVQATPADQLAPMAVIVTVVRPR